LQSIRSGAGTEAYETSPYSAALRESAVTTTTTTLMIFVKILLVRDCGWLLDRLFLIFRRIYLAKLRELSSLPSPTSPNLEMC
jgi:hypothetical protein